MVVQQMQQQLKASLAVRQQQLTRQARQQLEVGIRREQRLGVL
jgi:hypothetical protein